MLHGIIEWAWRQQCRYTGGTGQNDYLPRKQCLVECQEWRSESRKQVYGSSICISIYDLIIYIYYIYNTLDLGVFNLECSTDRILHNWMIWIGASIFCPIRPEIILLDYMQHVPPFFGGRLFRPWPHTKDIDRERDNMCPQYVFTLHCSICMGMCLHLYAYLAQIFIYLDK